MSQSNYAQAGKDSRSIDRALEEIARGVRQALCLKFPEMTAEEKEDIEQEVKLKMLRMISDGKKIVHYKSYVWKAVYTTALDMIGKRVKYLSPEEIEGNHDAPLLAYAAELCPQERLENSEKLDALRRAVDSLPKRRRAVLLLHISGLRLEEIAEHLGWSENTVRHLLYRGIESVKKKIRRREKAGFGAVGGAGRSRVKTGEGNQQP